MTGESATWAAVPRKKRFHEDALARFPRGTFERIREILREGEDRTDFIRSAVEKELRLRERKKAQKAEPRD